MIEVNLLNLVGDLVPLLSLFGGKMVKILITGFQHSGTTMLHQLIKAHPQVGWIENEECYIEYNKPKEWVLMFARKRVENLKKYAWGEKVPWGHRENDIEGKRPIAIIKKWMKYFKNDAKVLHIVRHPLDVVLSGHPGNKIVESNLSFVLDSVSRVINFTNTNKRCSSIVYEDLLTDPETHLHNIFTFLNLKSNNKIIKKVINSQLKFDKINADRAFAYKKKNVDRKVDYDGILKLIERRL